MVARRKEPTLLSLATKKPPQPLESVEQRLFVARVRLDPRCRDLLWTATANGGLRAKRTAGRMKAEGVNAGVPDLLFFDHHGGYTGLAIEMKRKPNKPTVEQAEWLDRLMYRQWRGAVCYSAEEAWAVLMNYLGLDSRLPPR